jgi:hypothetical protein
MDRYANATNLKAQPFDPWACTDPILVTLVGGDCSNSEIKGVDTFPLGAFSQLYAASHLRRLPILFPGSQTPP